MKRPRPAAAPRWLAPVALVGLAVAALVAWIPSTGGRTRLAREIEAIIDSQIRGDLSIGGIDRIDGSTLYAHDVRFEDESGEPVIVADQVEVEIDLGALAEGRFFSPRGRVHGGQVVLQTLETGELLIDRAFESPHPGPPGAPRGPDTVRLENLEADGLTLRLDFVGAPDGVVTGTSAVVMVRAPENAGVHIRADHIDGHAHAETPLPVDFEVEDGSLSIIGDSRRRAVIEIPSRIGGEPMAIDAVVRTDAHDAFRVDVDLHPGSPGAVFTGAAFVAQALLAETTTDALDVTVGGI